MRNEVLTAVALWAFDSFPLGWAGSCGILDSFCLQGIILVTIGLTALFVTGLCLKCKDSAWYKVTAVMGKVIGVIAAMMCVILSPHFEKSTLVIALVGSFLLVVRSPSDFDFPVIIVLLFMPVVYFFLEDIMWLDPNGYPRIAITLAFGMFVYVLLRFLRAVASVFSILMNVISCWPILATVAVVCVVEGVCLLSGCGSIYPLVVNLYHSSGGLVSFPSRVTGS